MSYNGFYFYRLQDHNYFWLHKIDEQMQHNWKQLSEGSWGIFIPKVCPWIFVDLLYTRYSIHDVNQVSFVIPYTQKGPSQRTSLLTTYTTISLRAVYLYVYIFYLCFWDDCMPCNLPVRNKGDLKENSCVYCGASIFTIKCALATKRLVYVYLLCLYKRSVSSTSVCRFH